MFWDKIKGDAAQKEEKKEEAKQYGETLYGQTQEETGQEIQDIVRRRKEMLDQQDPASSWIRQSASRRIQQARAQGGPQRMTEQQERQIGRQAESDIGKALYTTQSQNLTDYQKLMGAIASNQAATEMGFLGIGIAEQPVQMPKQKQGLLSDILGGFL